MAAPAVKLAQNPDVEAQFIFAFLSATLHTLKVQCNYPVAAQKARMLAPTDDLPVTICGIIGLVSNVFRGTVTLCLTDKVFLGMMSGMFNEKMDTVTKELSDGTGEILNIIFGTAKTTLTNEGLSVEKAIPTVVRGADIRVNSLTGGNPTIIVPFSGADGMFQLLISLDQKGK
jgi:chemotaxis protein CheX